MHMGNELLTLPVASASFALAGAGIGLASARARADLDERRVPLLGVLGAFVFAAQMVNFPVLPGVSGHFVGGALLAIVLGPHAAVLAMSAIVIVQCLVFQDGGLLALGANLLNMAVVGPYLGHAVFRLLSRSRATVSTPRLYLSVFLAALVSVVGGAGLVTGEIVASDQSRVPAALLLGALVGVHTLIGAVEGVITFVVLRGLARLRPGLVPAFRGSGEGVPLRTAIAGTLGAAVLVGGLISLVAADTPDGLEATLQHQPGAATSAPDSAGAVAAEWSERIALLPGYNRPAARWYWTSVSGVLGLLLVLGGAQLVGRALRRRRHHAPHPRV